MPVISSEETVLSQESERNGTEQEDRHENFLHNLALPINRLPPEILIAIINLSLPGPPTDTWTYPCLIFSWVCYYWRSVVLDNPIFWNRIPVSYWNPMVKEILLRSDDLPLDITGFNSNFIFRELGPDANRVRMLHLRGPEADDSYPPLSHFTSLFPSLTMLCLDDSHKTINLSIEPLPFFQALKVIIRNLGSLGLPNNFPNLWWLHLRYEFTLPVLPLLKALQNLPCLRVLYLFSLGSWWDLPDVPEGFITFHRLEALITESLQLITAPKLLYLEFTSVDSIFQKSYIFELKFITADKRLTLGGKFKMDTLDDDVTPLTIKNNFKSAFDETISSYPSEFNIPIDSSSAAPHLLSLFATIVKKSNNLNEISLNYHSLNPSEWTRSQTDREKNFIQDALRSATKVRNLTVFGNDFVTFCGYLHDGTLFPNLERLAYSVQKEQNFLDPLLELVTERSKTCPWPLEVELTGFSPVPPEALEPAERLGLRLIQNPRRPFS